MPNSSIKTKYIDPKLFEELKKRGYIALDYNGNYAATDKMPENILKQYSGMVQSLGQTQKLSTPSQIAAETIKGIPQAGKEMFNIQGGLDKLGKYVTKKMVTLPEGQAPIGLTGIGSAGQNDNSMVAQPTVQRTNTIKGIDADLYQRIKEAGKTPASYGLEQPKSTASFFPQALWETLTGKNQGKKDTSSIENNVIMQKVKGFKDNVEKYLSKSNIGEKISKAFDTADSMINKLFGRTEIKLDPKTITDSVKDTLANAKPEDILNLFATMASASSLPAAIPPATLALASPQEYLKIKKSLMGIDPYLYYELMKRGYDENITYLAGLAKLGDDQLDSEILKTSSDDASWGMAGNTQLKTCYKCDKNTGTIKTIKIAGSCDPIGTGWQETAPVCVKRDKKKCYRCVNGVSRATVNVDSNSPCPEGTSETPIPDCSTQQPSNTTCYSCDTKTGTIKQHLISNQEQCSNYGFEDTPPATCEIENPTTLTCYKCDGADLLTQEVAGETCPSGWSDTELTCGGEEPSKITCYKCDGANLLTQEFEGTSCPSGWSASQLTCEEPPQWEPVQWDISPALWVRGGTPDHSETYWTSNLDQAGRYRVWVYSGYDAPTTDQTQEEYRMKINNGPWGPTIPDQSFGEEEDNFLWVDHGLFDLPAGSLTFQFKIGGQSPEEYSNSVHFAGVKLQRVQ